MLHIHMYRYTNIYTCLGTQIILGTRGLWTILKLILAFETVQNLFKWKGPYKSFIANAAFYTSGH